MLPPIVIGVTNPALSLYWPANEVPLMWNDIELLIKFPSTVAVVEILWTNSPLIVVEPCKDIFSPSKNALLPQTNLSFDILP